MIAKELQTYLRSLNGGWVDPDTTVDTLKAGDPETEVTGIAVSWMCTTQALTQALILGCNVFVTHEPTYYNHRDDLEAPVFDFKGAQEKRRLVEESEFVIYRCHDLWDQMPEVGIPDAWGDALGLGEAVAGEGYYRVYDVGGRTAGDVARQVAERTEIFGQAAVQLIGEANAPVSRVAIGTGAITPLWTYLRDFEIDLAICTDDGFSYWEHGSYALDVGLPVIVVNHATSEEPGMIELAQTIQTQFPNVPVHFIPRGCLYTLVRANDNG
jgi:putative NIF3 family GTP cyclohydrolase 1 type 2